MKFTCLLDLASHWASEKGVDVPQLVAEICPADKPGDITLNCFRIAKGLRSNPMQLAQGAQEFLEAHQDVESVEVEKAFVNIILTPKATHEATVADAEAFFESVKLPEAERLNYLIEYSAPNTNKPLHLGHLRNNALGMALVEILKKVGHEVHPVNLVNDRGIHICRSMEAYKRFGNGETPESTGVKGDHFVGSFYVKYAQELELQVKALKEDEPGLAEQSTDKLFLQTEIGQATQRMLIDWENRVPEVIELWELMNSWVLAGFNQTYDRMGVYFDKCYMESETYKLGKDIIDVGLEKGVFYKREDGATEIDLKKYKLDKKVVLRSDGTSVYITQDIGTTILKADDFNPDAMVWVVGDEQIYHFKVLFAILKELGYEWADKLYHLAYGMVNLPSGRMKSREGTVVDADNLFDELHELAKAEIRKRFNGQELPADLEHRAEVIAQGAIKFMLLKVNPKTTMMFDPEAAVKFEGDTGAYLQYVCARIASMLRKASDSEVTDYVDWALLNHKKEKELSLCLARYPQVIQKAAQDKDTGQLGTYLLDLGKAFNGFYHDCPVLKSDVDPSLRRARLELSDRVFTTLKDGLNALTIDTLESM
ncbi:MAG: arginine--tRNA ligase [Lentisphaeria bacterium]|nr:arginine--tRNA ligase [Lentisphaeria bacterium]